MTVTQSEIAALIDADREDAHENACEALHAIRALQSTGTWMQLPLSVRRRLPPPPPDRRMDEEGEEFRVKFMMLPPPAVVFIQQTNCLNNCRTKKAAT